MNGLDHWSDTRLGSLIRCMAWIIDQMHGLDHWSDAWLGSWIRCMAWIIDQIHGLGSWIRYMAWIIDQMHDGKHWSDVLGKQSPCKMTQKRNTRNTCNHVYKKKPCNHVFSCHNFVSSYIITYSERKPRRDQSTRRFYMNIGNNITDTVLVYCMDSNSQLVSSQARTIRLGHNDG